MYPFRGAFRPRYGKSDKAEIDWTGEEMDTVRIATDSNSASGQFEAQKTEARLQDLIPIVMVIVGGCETCAEKMVARALSEGCAWQDIDRTLRITAGMQKMDCFASAVGPEVVSRMHKPLAAGRRSLERAVAPRAEAGCGCGEA